MKSRAQVALVLGRECSLLGCEVVVDHGAGAHLFIIEPPRDDGRQRGNDRLSPGVS